MKKLLCIVLVAFMMFMLVGCDVFPLSKQLPEKHGLNPEYIEQRWEDTGSSDNTDTIYYPILDYYNMQNTDTRTIIPHFETYQQTTSFSCGICSTLMVLNYYGEDVTNKWTEQAIIDDTGATHGGVNQNPIYDFFTRNYPDWYVERNENQSTKKFFQYGEFKDWVLFNLAEGHPIIVDWRIGGGHWTVIIGFDECGETDNDDVIIFADSSDAQDHYLDGFNCFPATRFYSMWKESNASDPSTTNNTLGVQQYVLAYPKNK